MNLLKESHLSDQNKEDLKFYFEKIKIFLELKNLILLQIRK